MYCAVCGDENVEPIVRRFWSADDGWQAGRLCVACKHSVMKIRPCPDDYAYDKRERVFGDEEEAIRIIYG